MKLQVYLKAKYWACEIAAFTPEKKTLYDESLMNERDILSQRAFAVNKARKEGREEGLAEGREEGKATGFAEGKRETAKNLLNKGLDISFISEVTGISENEIQGL